MQPSQPVLHQRGTKSRSIPLLKVLPDPGGLRCEFRLRAVKLTVVLQTMYANFEASLIQSLSNRVGSVVFAFGHKIKGRMETVFSFEVH